MSFHELGITVSEATVSVTAFDVVASPRAARFPARTLMRPVPTGHDALHFPVFAFLIEHRASGARILFDLGPRKDLLNGCPAIAAALRNGSVVMPVERDIVEQLEDTGVDVGSISAVIWSHAHFDHIGDMTRFPASTELVFGGAMSRATCVSDPKSMLVESDLADRKLVPLTFDSDLEISGFKAHDYFGDGSFYVLDVPGHLAGHVCALARVTPSSFVLLGGDACHHAGMLRPTTALHRAVPCPGAILSSARLSVCTTHFPPSDTAGEFDLAARTTPMLEVPEDGYYEEPPRARASIAKIGDFDANKDVFVVLAHDESLVDVVGPFPASLDAWQEKGWKSRVTWVFLDENNPAFRFRDTEPEAEL